MFPNVVYGDSSLFGVAICQQMILWPLQFPLVTMCKVGWEHCPMQ